MTKVPTGSWWRECLATFPSPYRPWRNVGSSSFSWNVWHVFCCCEFIVVMARSKILDLSREGKNLRVRIAALQKPQSFHYSHHGPCVIRPFYFQFRKKMKFYFLFVLFMNSSRFFEAKLPYCRKNTDMLTTKLKILFYLT